jgi:hypothetical protein
LIVTALSLAVVKSPDVRLAVDTGAGTDTAGTDTADWSFSDANRASDFFSAAGLIVTALSLAVVKSPDVRLAVDTGAGTDTAGTDTADWSFSDANRASDFFSAAGLIVTALSLAVVKSPDVRLAVDTVTGTDAAADDDGTGTGTADDSDEDDDVADDGKEAGDVFPQTKLLSE